jgi:hypothetical protein
LAAFGPRLLLGSAAGFAGFVHPPAELRPLRRAQLALAAGAPLFVYTETPAAEGAGWHAIEVQDIPSRIVAAPAVGGEAVERAVWNDAVRRLQVGGDNGGAEAGNRVCGGGTATAQECRARIKGGRRHADLPPF